MKFEFECLLPVREPYRLDLTAEALRRLAANVVDVVRSDGSYSRVLQDARGNNVIVVRQRAPDVLEIRIGGPAAERWLPTVSRMLGTEVDLSTWYQRVKSLPWLDRIARELRGLRPPRYPSLWEALAHAIVFQQISIHAAAAIMGRTITLLSPPIDIDGSAHYAFPPPEALLEANEEALRGAGLSTNKVAHLRSAALSVLEGHVDEARLAALPTPEAAAQLCTIRGIGPWSAAVVMLRGMGRLDVFPLRDSGVARTIRLLSADPDIDVDAVLDALGEQRGMLYFHLLLGRLRNLVPAPED